MFKQYHFRMKEALHLKNLFANLVATVDRVQIEFLHSANMVVINGTDIHQMAHFNCVIKRKAFSTFICPEDTTVSVQVHHLHGIFKCVEFGEWCDISLHKRGPHILEFNFEKTKEESCQVWLNTEQCEDETYEMPDLTRRPRVKMPSEEFARYINAFGRFDQDITLRATRVSLQIATNENNSSDVDISGKRTIQPSKTAFFSMDDAENSSNTFNSEFLVKAAKFGGLDTEVTLYPHCSEPFCISYNLGSLDTGRVDIHLAPREMTAN